MMLPLVANGTPLRICHTHNLYPGSNANDKYRNEGSACVSMDGCGIYWSSNWNEKFPTREVLEVRLPADWNK